VLIGLLVGAPAFSTLNAQGNIQDPGPGKGGPIIVPNFGTDIATLNPLLVQDGPSGDVVAQLFPGFIAADPDTSLPKPAGPGALAKSWTTSQDGLTFTFTLRSDWKWSDGTPITSADVKYAYDAVSSGKFQNNYQSFFDNIASVDAPDPTTIVVKLKTVDCSAIFIISGLPVVPSKTYQQVYSTDFAKMTPDNPYNLKPTVSAGPFKFSNFRPGEQVTLLADQTYPDAIAGHVIPQGWIYKNIADQTLEISQFLAGKITYIQSVPESRRAEMKKLGDQGKLQYFEAPSSGHQLISFNLTEPANPQSGVDKDGKPVQQGHHPVFGDVRVRQAFAMSVDHDALNKGAFDGFGSPSATLVLPDTWAFDADLKPWPYDPAKAAALLDQAGFVKDPSNPTGPRVANDKAMYAKPGTKLEFTLTSFSGNPSVDASNVLIQDELKATGFKMDIETIDFQTMVQKTEAHKYDASVFFLGMDPNDPVNTLIGQLGLPATILGSGLNTGSWYNKEFDDTLKQARSLAGCDINARKKLMARVQEIFLNEVPWYIVNYSSVATIAQPDLKNFAPKRFSVTWNLDAWFAPAPK